MIWPGLSVSGHRYRKSGHRRTVAAPGRIALIRSRAVCY